jgi:hypothetical protein
VLWPVGVTSAERLGTADNKRQPFSKQDESHIAASKESASCQESLASTLTGGTGLQEGESTTEWSTEPMRKIICALLLSGVIAGAAFPAAKKAETTKASHHQDKNQQHKHHWWRF